MGLKPNVAGIHTGKESDHNTVAQGDNSHVTEAGTSDAALGRDADLGCPPPEAGRGQGSQRAYGPTNTHISDLGPLTCESADARLDGPVTGPGLQQPQEASTSCETRLGRKWTCSQWGVWARPQSAGKRAPSWTTKKEMALALPRSAASVGFLGVCTHPICPTVPGERTGITRHLHTPQRGLQRPGAVRADRHVPLGAPDSPAVQAEAV